MEHRRRSEDDRLSWRERSAIEALEESLELDDPWFVACITAEAQALGRRRRGRRWTAPLRWLHRRAYPDRYA